MKIQCYSQRMLNPFRGIVNTIKYRSAEAVTTDGIHWDIYVRNEFLLADVQDENNPSKRIQVSEIRYATWTKAGGIKYGRRYQSEDYTRMAEQGDALYQKILNLKKLPFPLKDDYELWLLDQQHQPLALLESAVEEDEIALEATIEWRAGLFCKQVFQAQSFASQTSNNKITCAADRLTEIVNEAAGPEPAGQWFRKLNNDSKDECYYAGLDGINLDQQYIGRQLPGKAFPTGFITTKIFTGEEQSLLQEYLDWLAPWSLLRQDLPHETRKEMEILAARQAHVIEKQFRLYPEIIAQDVINAARVQAKLQKDEKTTEQSSDLIHDFYKEVGVNG